MDQSKLPFDHRSILSVVSFLADGSGREPSCGEEGDIWTLNGLFMRHLFSDSNLTEDMFYHLRGMLDASEKAEVGLASMRKQIESGVGRFHKQVDARFGLRRLDSLPDEIIMLIFEFAFDHGAAFEKSICYSTTGIAEADPNYLGNTLVRVSHRFRLIALRTPALWSIVTSVQTKMVRDASLARSKASGLHVFLIGFPSESDDDDTEHITTLLSHSRRWETLCMNFGWENEDSECSQLLYETQTKLELPMLRALSLCALFGSKEDGNQIDFYATWGMPNLACLTIEDMGPIPCFGSRLVQCEVILTKHYPENRQDETYARVNRLIKFLDSLHCLEKLRVAMRGFGFDGEDVVGSDSVGTLPALMALDLETDEISRHSAHQMMQILHTPNIQSLCVTFTGGDAIEEVYSRSQLIFCDYLPVRAYAYSSLRELRFVYFGLKYLSRVDTIIHLSTLLGYLSSKVEHIVIKTECPTDQWKSCKNPGTYLVRFKGYNGSDAFSEWYTSPISLGSIKSVEIIGHPDFSECVVVHARDTHPKGAQV